MPKYFEKNTEKDYVEENIVEEVYEVTETVSQQIFLLFNTGGIPTENILFQTPNEGGSGEEDPLLITERNTYVRVTTMVRGVFATISECFYIKDK